MGKEGIRQVTAWNVMKIMIHYCEEKFSLDASTVTKKLFVQLFHSTTVEASPTLSESHSSWGTNRWDDFWYAVNRFAVCNASIYLKHIIHTIELKGCYALQTCESLQTLLSPLFATPMVDARECGKFIATQNTYFQYSRAGCQMGQPYGTL